MFFLSYICLSGCHTPERANVYTSLSIDETINQAVSSPNFTEGPWPSRQWWHLFSDDQLSSLIEKAISSNPSIQKAQAKLTFIEQSAKKVRASLFPQLSGDYNENWQYFSKNGFVRSFYPIPSTVAVPSKINQIDLSLNFFYEFDFWGRNRKMYRAAIGEAKAQLAERIQTELTISTLVAYAYFELQTHMMQLSLYENILETRQKILLLTEEQNLAGVKNMILPLDEAKEVLLIEQTIADLQKNISVDQYVLASLLAEGPDDTPSIEMKKISYNAPLPLPKMLGADLLSRRADLMALIWRVEAASEEIGVARTDFYPNINLAAFAGIESLQFPSLFNWSSRTGALQPAIHLPLFTGGKLQANLSSKVAKFNEAVHSYNEGLLQAAQEVAAEISTVDSLYKRIAIQNQINLSREDKEQMILDLYTSGVENMIHYLQAHQDTLQEKIKKQELENYHLHSIVRLMKSLGGGYESEEIPSLAR